MIHRRAIATMGVVALLAAPASCALATGLDDFVVGGRCNGAEDCPGVDTECSTKSCVEGACLYDVLPLGTPCMQGACNGEGACLRATGDACQAVSDCASGHCVDGVCCTEACDATCAECLTTPGTCNAVDAGESDDACASPAVCDGVATCTAGEIQWAATLPTIAATSTALSVTLVDDGVLTTGYLRGPTKFGDTDVPYGGPNYDPYVAKYGLDGTPQWIDAVTQPQEAIGDAIVTVTENLVVQAGRFVNTIMLDGQAVPGTPWYSIYLLGLDPATGTHLWARGFPDAGGGLASAQALELTADGTDVLMGGYIQAATDFGTGVIGTNGTSNAVLVRADGPSGTTRWANAYNSGGEDTIRGIAVDQDGNILIVGNTTGALDLGGGPMMSADLTSDPFVAKLRSDGSHVWSQTFTALGGNAWGRGVSTDADGHVYISGWHEAAIQMGDFALPSVGNPSDGFVAKLDGATGEVVWAFNLGGSNSEARDVRVNAAGHVIVTGFVSGIPNQGTVAGTRDAFVASYTGERELLWFRTFGAPDGVQQGIDLTLDADRIAVAGYFETALLAAEVLHTSDGTLDPWVAVLTP